MISSDARRLGEEAAQRLARTGWSDIGPGLTDDEFARIEQAYEFEFADDHRAFLAAGLPLNSPAPGRRSPWPDWRDADPGDLRERLGWPVEGALFDVERNALWHPSWGQRPAGTSEALSAARQHLNRAPKMIPVYGHRYIPAGRATYGHPVLTTSTTNSAGTPPAQTGRRRPWCRSGATSSDSEPCADRAPAQAGKPETSLHHLADHEHDRWVAVLRRLTCDIRLRIATWAGTGRATR